MERLRRGLAETTTKGDGEPCGIGEAVASCDGRDRPFGSDEIATCLLQPNRVQSGQRRHSAELPERGVHFGAIVLAAIAVNLLACTLGALIFARLGLASAATVGLVSGNRNVTLAWAAGGFILPALAQEYLAACVIPVLVLPLVVKAVLALTAPWLRRPIRDLAIPLVRRA